jgi:hypothetical protein
MEEFVLIPKRQFVEEKTQMSQILNNPNFTNKSAHLSFLQRNADNSYARVDNSGSTRYYGKKQTTKVHSYFNDDDNGSSNE